MKLKRIGIKYAQRIIDDREKCGNSHKIEDLMRIRMVGHKRLGETKDKIAAV